MEACLPHGHHKHRGHDYDGDRENDHEHGHQGHNNGGVSRTDTLSEYPTQLRPSNPDWTAPNWTPTPALANRVETADPDDHRYQTVLPFHIPIAWYVRPPLSCYR